MAIVYSKFSENHREFEEDEDGRGSYTLEFSVRTDTTNYDGAKLIEEAQTASPNPVPSRGTTFLQQQLEDAGSFCRFRSARIVDKKDPHLWIVRARYEPLRDGEEVEHLTEPNPLLWPTITWTTWKEIQVPLEVARCISDYYHVARGPAETVPKGPVINAVGQQTIEPLMVSLFHPLKHVKRNYASEEVINDLNLQYANTVNDSSFYNAGKQRWKYSITHHNGVRRKHIPGQGLVDYIPATTVFEQNPVTWVRKVLNNGMVSFQLAEDSMAYALDDNGDKQIFDILVDNGEGNMVPTSEPLNLNADGTYTPGTIANFAEFLPGSDADFISAGFGGNCITAEARVNADVLLSNSAITLKDFVIDNTTNDPDPSDPSSVAQPVPRIELKEDDKITLLYLNGSWKFSR